MLRSATVCGLVARMVRWFTGWLNDLARIRRLVHTDRLLLSPSPVLTGLMPINTRRLRNAVSFRHVLTPATGNRRCGTRAAPTFQTADAFRRCSRSDRSHTEHSRMDRGLFFYSMLPNESQKRDPSKDSADRKSV